MTDNPAAESAPSLGSLADVATGVELDALVAEHIFGWKRVAVPVDANGQNAGETLLPPNVRLQDCEAVLPKVGKIGTSAFCRPWSESLANADEVLDRMRRRGWDWDIETRDDSSWGANCYKFPKDQAPAFYEGDATAPGLPEAICRAALKAIRDEQVNP